MSGGIQLFFKGLAEGRGGRRFQEGDKEGEKADVTAKVINQGEVYLLYSSFNFSVDFILFFFK